MLMPTAKTAQLKPPPDIRRPLDIRSKKENEKLAPVTWKTHYKSSSREASMIVCSCGIKALVKKR